MEKIIHVGIFIVINIIIWFGVYSFLRRKKSFYFRNKTSDIWASIERNYDIVFANLSVAIVNIIFTIFKLILK